VLFRPQFSVWPFPDRSSKTFFNRFLCAALPFSSSELFVELLLLLLLQNVIPPSRRKSAAYIFDGHSCNEPSWADYGGLRCTVGRAGPSARAERPARTATKPRSRCAVVVEVRHLEEDRNDRHAFGRRSADRSRAAAAAERHRFSRRSYVRTVSVGSRRRPSSPLSAGSSLLDLTSVILLMVVSADPLSRPR